MNSTAQSQVDLLKAQSNTLEALYELNRIVSTYSELKVITKKIVELVPKKLGYEFGILALLNTKTGMLEIVAKALEKPADSKTEPLNFPFEEIKIPITNEQNVGVQAIRERKQIISENLYELLQPVIDKKTSKEIQERRNINTSIINPIYARNKPIGLFIVGTTQKAHEIAKSESLAIQEFSESVGLVVENAKLYLELKNAYTDLQQLDKVKDDFIAVTSHELRTPLTIINSYLWVLASEKKGPLNTSQIEYVKKAISGGDRMIQLINDILNISKLESGRISYEIDYVDIKNVIGEIANEFKIKTEEKEIYLHLDLDEKATTVFTDKNKLEDILLNLLGNALKFTSEGGITIKTTSLSSGSYIRISITDTGMGIKKGDESKLFSKFGKLNSSYQNTAETGGTGLGLYIVKHLVEQMGGSTGVKSEGLGYGTTFWIVLPAKPITGSNSWKSVNSIVPELWF